MDKVKLEDTLKIVKEQCENCDIGEEYCNACFNTQAIKRIEELLKEAAGPC